MTELNFEEPFETADVEIPSTLPVLRRITGPESARNE